MSPSNESRQSSFSSSDRRQKAADFSTDLHCKLSQVQHLAISTLNQFGFSLAYIRNSDHGALAILKQDQKLATVDHGGAINTRPRIQLRA